MKGPPSTDEAATGHDAAAIDLSFVRDDVAFRIQQRLGLIPAQGMGGGRRAVLFAAITWVPLAAWAFFTQRAFGARADDALLAHFGVHVRCLIAIPLFVIAEDLAHRSVPPLLRYFVESGLVTVDNVPRFKALIAGVARMRDRVLPWVVIFGLVVAWTSVGMVLHKFEDMSWATANGAPETGMTFGGWWFVLVIRPLFSALLLAWLWRACLLFLLFVRLAQFPLSFVPTHPDRVGGLGFVDRFALVLSPVAFAVSAVVAASFAHEVLYHGVSVADIKGELIATVVVIAVVFLAPFLPLAKPLGAIKRNAIMDYGSIVARHGRLVHRRWVLGEEIGSPDILDAPELGPVADVHTVFDAVKHMRRVPVGKLGLAAIVLPASIPMLFVFAIQTPLQSILVKILKTLI